MISLTALWQANLRNFWCGCARCAPRGRRQILNRTLRKSLSGGPTVSVAAARCGSIWALWGIAQISTQRDRTHANKPRNEPHTNEPADTKAHTHEGAHQHRPTNQPAPGIGFCAAKTYCIVALMVKILVVTSLSCGININFWNLQNNAPTRQKVAEDRERAAGPRARADP